MLSSKRNNYRALATLSLAVLGLFYMTPGFSADSTVSTASSEKKNVDFLGNAALIDLAEVSLGKLGDKKAQHPDVKALAQHMLHDHGKHSDQLKKIAAQLRTDLPQKMDAEHQQLYDKLAQLDGKKFDEEFTHAMVEGHKKAIAFYESAAKNETHADLRNFFNDTIPTLQEHLRTAQKTEAALATKAVKESAETPSNVEAPKPAPAAR
jgi:putative membrane protein